MATTEKERMLAGELYRAADPDLVAERQRARLLTGDFNQSRADDGDRRRALLARLFAKLGARVVVEPPFHCDYGYNIELGDGVEINFACVILDCAPVILGDGVLVGPSVQICAGTHTTDPAVRRAGRELARPIRIDAHAWIGAGAFIGPGVHIGANSVVGAGSVVVRDIPADVVAAGNPCRVIRSLFADR